MMETGKITLLNCDCMEFLKGCKDKAYNIAIVDPPYGLGAVNFNTKGFHKEKDWNNAVPGPEYFNELYRVSQHQIIWGCNYFYPHVTVSGRIVFDKKIPNHGMQNFSDCDLASQSFDRTIKLFKYEWRGNVQNGRMNIANDGPDQRVHPTQKPIALYEWLLRKYAKPTDKIIDTHLGSASSAIAAYYFGCDFVGTEIDTEYFEAAKNRFDLVTKQTKLQFAS